MLDRSEQQAIRRKGSGVFQFLDCCLRCLQFLWPHELHAIFQAPGDTAHVVYLKSWRRKGYWRRPLRKEGDSSQVAVLLPHRTDWACTLILSGPAMFTSVVPVGLLLLTAVNPDYPPDPVQESCNSWYDMGTVFEVFANIRLATHTLSSLKFYMV